MQEYEKRTILRLFFEYVNTLDLWCNVKHVSKMWYKEAHSVLKRRKDTLVTKTLDEWLLHSDKRFKCLVRKSNLNEFTIQELSYYSNHYSYSENSKWIMWSEEEFTEYLTASFDFAKLEKHERLLALLAMKIFTKEDREWV
jgi:hypothetical protein